LSVPPPFSLMLPRGVLKVLVRRLLDCFLLDFFAAALPLLGVVASFFFFKRKEKPMVHLCFSK
jgi:hypothetical protein